MNLFLSISRQRFPTAYFGKHINSAIVVMMQGNLVGSTLVLVAWSYVIGPRSVLAQGNNNQIDPYGGNYGDGNRGQGAYTPVPSPTYGGNDEEQGE